MVVVFLFEREGMGGIGLVKLVLAMGWLECHQKVVTDDSIIFRTVLRNENEMSNESDAITTKRTQLLVSTRPSDFTLRVQSVYNRTKFEQSPTGKEKPLFECAQTPRAKLHIYSAFF